MEENLLLSYRVYLNKCMMYDEESSSHLTCLKNSRFPVIHACKLFVPLSCSLRCEKWWNF